MDPRIRALLEPKAFAKGEKKDKKATANASSKASQKLNNDSNASPAKTSTNALHSAYSYDPKRLLDPRGMRKSRQSRKSPPTGAVESASANSSDNNLAATRMPVAQVRRENSGSRSMLEDLYNVERRVEPPTKRAKLNTESEESTTMRKNNARTYHSSGIMGDYMSRKEDEEDLTIDHRKVVDLTNLEDEESDDDIKTVKVRNVTNQQEVCYGSLATNVLAHAIPHPKTQNLYNDTSMWASIKCTAIRKPSKDTIIEVADTQGFIFGRIDFETANILTPCLDALKNFSLEPRINPRKRKPNEEVHKPCSDILPVSINLYGRRGDAEKVATILGRRNLWLRTPIMAKPGIEVVNPHARLRQDLITAPQTTHRANLYSENRTVEEATRAVTKLFDHYANSAQTLEETEANEIVITPLLPHQKQALTFMLQRESPRTFGNIESQNSSLWRKKVRANGSTYYEETVTGVQLKEEPQEVYGGLLADVMGLGKTIEALALIAHTTDQAKQYGELPLLRNDPSESCLVVQSKATLIVAPVSTVKNWEDQISEHILPGALSAYVYHGAGREKDPQKLGQYDIVISTYSTIAIECSPKGNVFSPIKAIRWFRIILDEAHTIREARANQSQAMCSLIAQRRWCLTGTPIQNRLDDLGSLTRFLRLYPYDTTVRFIQYIRAPAQSGDPNYLKSLRIFIDSFTLRRQKDRVDLPHRTDLIVGLKFSASERKLHDFFRTRASVQIEEMTEERKQRAISQHHVLRAIMTLRLICDHGHELLKEQDTEAFQEHCKTDVIDVDAEPDHNPPTLTTRTAYETLSLMAEAGLDMCVQCDKRIGGESPRTEGEDTDDIRGYMLPCYDLFCHDCFDDLKVELDKPTKFQTTNCPHCSVTIASSYVPIPRTMAEMLEMAPEQTSNGTSEAYKRGTYTGPSTKVKALLDDLNEIETQSAQLIAEGQPPLKSVVFSEFTSNLDLIEKGLDANGFSGRYVRIDGSMSLNQRKTVLDSLNSDNNIVILLASIKAAGQGLNLTAASRAFIMEPMWNPAAEIQAVDRIYRIGQTRKVVVKRFRMNDSIEGKIVQLQQKKQALADISMNKNHKLLSKKETREQSMKEILLLFK